MIHLAVLTGTDHFKGYALLDDTFAQNGHRCIPAVQHGCKFVSTILFGHPW